MYLPETNRLSLFICAHALMILFTPYTPCQAAAAHNDNQKKLDGQLFDAIETNNAAGVRQALEAGASFNAVKVYSVKYTPLGLAAEKGYPDCIEALIAAGADVNVKGPEDKWSPLELAITGRNWRSDDTMRERSIKLLLKAGAKYDVGVYKEWYKQDEKRTIKDLLKEKGYKHILKEYFGGILESTLQKHIAKVEESRAVANFKAEKEVEDAMKKEEQAHS